MTDVIIAQCTPQGAGALALIRLSGDGAVEIATAISKLPHKKTIFEQQTHTIHFAHIVDGTGVLIDQVMLLLMRAPSTFTGQDTVEITCHNNQFIIEAIIQAAIAAGARLAQEGEFSRRAVLNNKIDLVQAEAINELIHANNAATLKQSLRQLQGSFSHWISDVEQQLLDALALAQASFEFIDEELEFGNQIKEILRTVATSVSVMKQQYNVQQQLRSGIRIALIGSVNAGKSSLFNALVGKQRAIVSPTAGTTRDSIEAGIYVNGIYRTYIDTAGLRSTKDLIEQEGIERSLQEAHAADVILLVIDASRPATSSEVEAYIQFMEQHEQKIIVVHTKTDIKNLPELGYEQAILVSSTQLVGIDQLNQQVEDRINQLCQLSDAPFLLNQRQWKLLLSMQQQLSTIEAHLNKPIAYELLAHDLQDILAQLSELTGKTISEQGMDAIFKQFCIGK